MLDALDGVIARDLIYNGRRDTPLFTAWLPPGFDGPLLDKVTDTIGVAAFLIALLCFVLRLPQSTNARPCGCERDRICICDAECGCAGTTQPNTIPPRARAILLVVLFAASISVRPALWEYTIDQTELLFEKGGPLAAPLRTVAGHNASVLAVADGGPPLRVAPPVVAVSSMYGDGVGTPATSLPSPTTPHAERLTRVQLMYFAWAFNTSDMLLNLLGVCCAISPMAVWRLVVVVATWGWPMLAALAVFTWGTLQSLHVMAVVNDFKPL